MAFNNETQSSGSGSQDIPNEPEVEGFELVHMPTADASIQTDLIVIMTSDKTDALMEQLAKTKRAGRPSIARSAHRCEF